jgi:CelD/BcsL family acetyltransferase involved in cellulose biosynthesis
MNRLTLAEFRDRAEEFAAAVAVTPGVCEFCSGPLWQLAARARLGSEMTSEEEDFFIVERDGVWLLFAEKEPTGIHFPLEASWMFGCPLAGDPAAAVALLRDAAREESLRRGHPLAFFIGGLVADGPIHRALQPLRPVSRHWREYPGMDVMRIDLGDGFEAWEERRSKKFRRSLRGLAGTVPGLEILDLSKDDPDAIFARILVIQQATYKWQEGTDIFQMPGYAAFYRELLEGLHAAGDLRVLVARRGGIDLAHIFGGVAGKTYRGLQMSYLEEVRDLALGNRLQLENLRRCAQEGITIYDLGMHAPYKERWADRWEKRIGVLWVG